MAIDEADNVYVASFDTDGGPMVAVSFLASGSRTLVPLKSGTHAWCVALDAQKRIYYSTGRSFNSIGRLTPCLPPPLRVSLDSPAHRAAFVFPATIQLEASVQDVDGLVTNVSFFEGTHKLGEAAAGPFRFEWTNAAPGSYALAAIAADDQGRFGTSAPVRIWVQSSNTPPGPAVWVFHDEDPDWTNPPFDDTLAGLDDAGQPVVALGGFNSAQTIGGNRTIATTKEGDAVLVCENVANRLSKLDVFGQPLFSLPRPITAIDLAADGTIFALEDHTGTIFGENLLRLSADGVLQEQVAAGGFDLVVDDEHQAIFVVGADLKYLGYDLRVHWTIDPIAWCAVSVDLASDGSAWVAERLHPQVFGSANRLLKVSSQGTVLTTMALPYSPFCVRVDRTDDSIYVAGDRFYKYDADGHQLFATDVGQSQGSFQPAWSLAIDPAGDIWVGTFRDVRKFTANGNLLFTASEFSYPSDTYVAVPAPSVAAPPIVIAEPQRQMVTVGGTATFSVTATGTRPLHYQWHRNAVPLADDERISGATTPALSLHKVGAADIGEYSVSIENRLGSVSSAAAGLVVRPPELASERFGNLLMLFWPAVSPDVAFESSP
ncbi:MAG TPA: Ig-like domain-containing protein, partial [Candidatus Dormibacteraeota bacterium]|nr:Ig-like domain-containing protein [Candidatus Dormibacteraeota bacterium]